MEEMPSRYGGTGDKTDDMKGRFYEELEHVFDKFP
jgi:hypothetical protein